MYYTVRPLKIVSQFSFHSHILLLGSILLSRYPIKVFVKLGDTNSQIRFLIP